MKTASDILLEELGKLQDEIISNHERAGQVTTGKTKASIDHYLVNPYRGVLVGPAYMGALEDGRGPAKGKGSANSDFLENLKQWISIKWSDIKDEEDLERKAKFLKWWINKNGTWAFRNKQHTEIYTKAVDQFSQRIKSRLSEFYQVKVTTEINKAL